MDKGIGFNRTIKLTWLDATAALCAEGLGAPEIRTRLAPVIGQQIASAENQRKAADILINIWINTASISPALHGEAIAAFGRAATAADRLVLHYGLALLAYPFLRETAAVIGALTRSAGELTQVALKQRLIAGRGQLGSLEKAVERILASLTDWGALNRDRQRHTYTPPAQPIGAASVTTETWLLACAALAHPAEELPFSDLLRLPELYPFRFSVSVDDLRACPWFAVQRQGGEWDMVRLSGVLSWPTPPPAIPNMARMTMSF